MVDPMTGALSFLDRVLAVPGVEASFIPRIPGIPLTDDKWSALRDLEPAHREAVGRLGFGWEDLWRAEQVHGDAVALVPMETMTSPGRAPSTNTGPVMTCGPSASKSRGVRR